MISFRAAVTVCLLLPLWPTDTRAQSSSSNIEITPRETSEVFAVPGRRNAVVFRLYNHSDTAVIAVVACRGSGLAGGCTMRTDSVHVPARRFVRIPVDYRPAGLRAGAIELLARIPGDSARGEFTVSPMRADRAPQRTTDTLAAGAERRSGPAASGASGILGPVIVVNPASGTFGTNPVDVEIVWCPDSTPMDGFSRQIRVNRVIVTNEFTYEDGFPECLGAKYSYGEVAFTAEGTASMSAYICDKQACTTERVSYVLASDRPTITAVNNPTRRFDRAACVRGEAGPGLWSCGELLLSAGMPGYRSNDTERALTLLYSGGTASPRPVIRGRISLESGTPVPDSVRASLVFAGVNRGTWTYTGLSSPSSRQISLTFNDAGLATGVHPFTITLTSYGSYGTRVSSTTGEAVVIKPCGQPVWGRLGRCRHGPTLSRPAQRCRAAHPGGRLLAHL